VHPYSKSRCYGSRGLFSTGLYADIANRNKNLTSFDKSNINKLSQQNSNGSGSDGPFTASSMIEDGDNNLFTGQDVRFIE
jgi:hypothetical protein